jgi:hypothetical protein
MKRESSRTLIKVFALLCTICITGCTESQQLEGAWNLQQYVMAGDEQEDVSGLLVLAEGRFGLIYTMHRNGDLNGRGHAGGYSSEENRLIFDVQWWPEEVDGAARAAEPIREVAEVGLDGDVLELRFGSGSLQRWHRVAPAGQQGVAGALQVQSMEQDGRQRDANGLLANNAGQFTFFVDAGGKDGSGDVRAYGGTITSSESDGDESKFELISNWYVAFTDGEGDVSNSEQSMTLQLRDADAELVHRADGRTYRLRQ